MKNLFGIGILVVSLIVAVTAYNESVASKVYSQAQAESMIIRAMSQASQATMTTMFPYFVLGLGFIALILVLIVWLIISENRNNVLAAKPYIERHVIESQKVILLGKPQDRKGFYQTLNINQPEKAELLADKKGGGQ